jgi:gas vesicle protein
MSKTSSVILAVLAGAAAGLVVGVLIAPDKGSENRKKISDAAKKLADNLLSKAESAVEEVASAVKHK